jgi:hypothetical protein
MTLDKTQLTNMTTRQKAIAGVIVLVIILLLWQVVGLFGGDKDTTTPAAAVVVPTKNAPNANDPNGKNSMNSLPSSQSAVPQPAQITQQQMNYQQQNQLIKLQQETQQKYVIALNELQMLKLSQQIAETNKNIASAKLATVTAEKGIVDLLTKPAPQLETPSSYSQGLVNPVNVAPQGANVPPSSISPPPQQVVNASYVVISVSKLLNKWSAVVGYQGKLYSIFVGDVLPVDGSSVKAIDKYGIILEKDGVSRKISMVPII